MKRIALTCSFMILIIAAQSQWSTNMILNPNFEFGTVPPGSLLPWELPDYLTDWEKGCTENGSPDVFDPNAPDCFADPQYSVDVPNNKWGSLNASLGARYVGFTSGEPVMGKITPNLVEGCTYRLRLKAACSTTIYGNCGVNNLAAPANMTIEVRLRNSADPCNGVLLLFATGTFNNTVWNYFEYVFTATSAMTNFDRIEFTAETTTFNQGNPYSKPVYLDDVGLEKSIVTVSIAPGSSSPICGGESVTLNSTGTGTWLSIPFDPSLNGQQNNNSITVSPGTNTTYIFVNECSYDVVYILVNPAPSVNLGPDQLICDGNSITLNAGPGFSNYQWSQPGICPFGGALMNACVTGNYCVTVTDGNGCTASDCAFVTITNMPNIFIFCTDPEICPGETVTLSSTACPGCTYLWSPGGYTNSTIFVTPATTTTYSVVVTNTAGCTDNASQTVTVVQCKVDDLCMYIEKTDDHDIGRNVAATADGGFVVVGDLHQSATDRDMYIVKYAPDMTTQFKKRFGDFTHSLPVLQESAYSVLPVEDGYFVIGTLESSPGNIDFAITRFNSTGGVTWRKKYNASQYDRNDYGIKVLRALTATGAYRYYAVGYTDSYSTGHPGDYDAFVMQFNPGDGTVLSIKRFGNTITVEKINDAIIDNTNSYILLAGELITTGGNREMYSLKIDLFLNLVSTLLVQGSNVEYANSISQTVSDNTSAYLAGSSRSISMNDDIYIVKVNMGNYTAVTGRTFVIPPNQGEWATDISPTSDNNLVVVGTTSTGNGLILKIEPDFDIVWARESTDANTEQYNSVAELSNGQFAITGKYALSSSDDEILITRTDNLGASCCNEPKYPLLNNLLSQKPQGPSFSFNVTPSAWGVFNDYYNEYYLCQTYIDERNSHENITNIISSPDAFHKVVISPNPSFGIFTIQSDEKLNSICVYDLSGRQLQRSGYLSNSTIEVDLSGLNDGIYILEATGENFKQREKIIVRK